MCRGRAIVQRPRVILFSGAFFGESTKEVQQPVTRKYPRVGADVRAASSHAPPAGRSRPTEASSAKPSPPFSNGANHATSYNNHNHFMPTPFRSTQEKVTVTCLLYALVYRKSIATIVTMYSNIRLSSTLLIYYPPPLYTSKVCSCTVHIYNRPTHDIELFQLTPTGKLWISQP